MDTKTLKQPFCMHSRPVVMKDTRSSALTQRLNTWLHLTDTRTSEAVEQVRLQLWADGVRRCSSVFLLCHPDLIRSQASSAVVLCQLRLSKRDGIEKIRLKECRASTVEQSAYECLVLCYVLSRNYAWCSHFR